MAEGMIMVSRHAEGSATICISLGFPCRGVCHEGGLDVHGEFRNGRSAEGCDNAGREQELVFRECEDGLEVEDGRQRENEAREKSRYGRGWVELEGEVR